MSKERSTLKKRQRRGEFLTALPLVLFTLLFIVGPMVYMVALSFMTRAETWGVVPQFTLKNYAGITEPVYLSTFWGVPEAGGHQHGADYRHRLPLWVLYGQAGP